MTTERTVYFTVDAEPDCPPALWTWRGMDEGMEKLLAVFDEEQVRATVFATGESGERYPELMRRIVADGHELANHGYSHQRFSWMSPHFAEDEIARTNEILRPFGPVTSFRAPYLSFRESFLPMLVRHGLTVDASRGAYKRNRPRLELPGGPARLEASVTSSVLRLPRVVRNPWFATLKSPVTMFVHPWEFVDLRDTNLRYDCRFRTGDKALDCVRTTLRFFKARGFTFKLARDFASAGG